MKTLYQNFDGLDVTFQGCLPDEIADQLAAAKLEAQKLKKDAPASLGTHALPVMVMKSGGGGYAYVFSTTEDGEVWFVNKSAKLDGWNIRVSVKSLALATHGYEEVKARIISTLAKLEAKGLEGHVKESVSRFDYCVDVLVPETLRPHLDDFVAHQRTKKELEGVVTQAQTQGGKVLGVRMGKMPNRQVALYNKTEEIKVSGKAYWWDFWKLPKTIHGAVWRVEVRAGKAELDNWNIKSFSDLEARAGDVVDAILKAYRYTKPNGDSNHSRWPTHPLWQAAVDACVGPLAKYRSNAKRGKILEGLRLLRQENYKTNMLGTLVSYTALTKRELEELPAVWDELKREFELTLAYHPHRVESKFNYAVQRFGSLS